MTARIIKGNCCAIFPAAIFMAIMLVSVVTPISIHAQQAPSPQPIPKPATQEPVRSQEPTEGEESDEIETDEEAESLDPTTQVFVATAYSLRGKTASGLTTRRGIIAADPKVLPLGSIIRLRAGEYSGIYMVLDTGLKVRGRLIDIWVSDYIEAIEFGRRKVRVEVLRYGWDPTIIEISRL
jgi:3D (Asp-Asp-Asp) domain-containing protein